MENLPTIPAFDNAHAKSFDTLELKVDYFTHLPANKLSIISEPCSIQNLPWFILVKKKGRYRSLPQSVGIHVQCNRDAENTSWSCKAKVTISILSQKPGIKDCTREFEHEFSSDEDFWGFDRFMAWNEVIDPDRGFIFDNAITIRAHIVADRPTFNRAVKRKSICSSHDEDELTEDDSESPVKRAKDLANEPDHILNTISQRAKRKPKSPGKLKETNEKKMKSLESELLQLKQDLVDEKSNSDRMAEELKAKSVKLDTFYGSIASLEKKIVTSSVQKMCEDIKGSVALLESKFTNVEGLRSELDKVDLKLQEFIDDRLKKDKEKDDSSKEAEFDFESLKNIISGLEVKVANVEAFQSGLDYESLKSAISGLESKVANVEALQSALEKVELKLKEFSEHFEKEKERSEAYKDLLRKVLI